MNIDRKTVLHVAKLAHLELSDSDVAHYEKQLGRILDYVKLLETVPKDAPLNWRAEADEGCERPDEIVPPLSPDEALAMAPERHDSAFQVPKIIE